MLQLTAILRSVYPNLSPYIALLPDLPIEEMKKALGKEKITKLSFNENPLGPSPKALAAMAQALQTLNLYPASVDNVLQAALAAKEGVNPKQIVFANGADEMIVLTALAFLAAEDEAIIPAVTFVQYLAAVNLMGAKPVLVQLTPDFRIDLDGILKAITPKTKLIFLCNPNNPTGRIIPEADMAAFLAQVPENILVVVDEAYHEYAADSKYDTSIKFIGRGTPLLVIRTFSKIYSLAAARLGYGISSPELAAALNRFRLPFNINGVVQAGALASLGDEGQIQKARDMNEVGKQIVYEGFAALGWDYIPTNGNFVFVDTGRDAQWIYEQLLEEGIVVRTLAGYGLNSFLRVSIGKENEMRALIEALKRIVDVSK